VDLLDVLVFDFVVVGDVILDLDLLVVGAVVVFDFELDDVFEILLLLLVVVPDSTTSNTNNINNTTELNNFILKSE
jgi:hypothetical protein